MICPGMTPVLTVEHQNVKVQVQVQRAAKLFPMLGSPNLELGLDASNRMSQDVVDLGYRYQF